MMITIPIHEQFLCEELAKLSQEKFVDFLFTLATKRQSAGMNQGFDLEINKALSNLWHKSTAGVGSEIVVQK